MKALDLHIQQLTKPSDLASARNGQLVRDFLEPTESGDVLHHVAARAFDAMHAKAASDGIALTLTGGYRPYAVQENLFLDRYLDHYNVLKTTMKTKSWMGRKWWKRYGVATAAAPGTSNHGWGLAVDVSTPGLGSVDAPGPTLRWLATHAGDYGFSWELLPEEPWHLHYCPGDDIPAAVLAFEAVVGRTPVAPSIPVVEDDMYFVQALDGPDPTAIWQIYRHEATGLLLRKHVPGVEWAVLRHRFESTLTRVPFAELEPIAVAPEL